FARELVGQVFDDACVEVFAAQEGIASGGEYVEDAVLDFENGDVESAAAEIEDGDGDVEFFAESKGQCRGGGLVDDANDVQSGDASGVFGGVALRVVEIRGHGDDGFERLFAEVFLGDEFHFLQDDAGNFGQAVFFVAQFDADVFVGPLDDFECRGLQVMA